MVKTASVVPLIEYGQSGAITVSKGRVLRFPTAVISKV